MKNHKLDAVWPTIRSRSNQTRTTGKLKKAEKKQMETVVIPLTKAFTYNNDEKAIFSQKTNVKIS